MMMQDPVKGFELGVAVVQMCIPLEHLRQVQEGMGAAQQGIARINTRIIE